MFVCGECCVLSGRCLCVGLITRPEQSYRMVCVCERERERDREASKMRRPWPTRGHCSVKKNKPTFKVFRENMHRMLDERSQNCSCKEMEGIINKVSEKMCLKTLRLTASCLKHNVLRSFIFVFCRLTWLSRVRTSFRGSEWKCDPRCCLRDLTVQIYVCFVLYSKRCQTTDRNVTAVTHKLSDFEVKAGKLDKFFQISLRPGR
jgi:hypothetical protein